MTEGSDTNGDSPPFISPLATNDPDVVSMEQTHGYNMGYSAGHPLHGQIDYGPDISAAAGTPVNAVADGRITYAGWVDGYGFMVVLAHQLEDDIYLPEDREHHVAIPTEDGGRRFIYDSSVIDEGTVYVAQEEGMYSYYSHLDYNQTMEMLAEYGFTEADIPFDIFSATAQTVEGLTVDLNQGAVFAAVGTSGNASDLGEGTHTGAHLDFRLARGSITEWNEAGTIIENLLSYPGGHNIAGMTLGQYEFLDPELILDCLIPDEPWREVDVGYDLRDEIAAQFGEGVEVAVLIEGIEGLQTSLALASQDINTTQAPTAQEMGITTGAVRGED